jgi:hypothetical protein
MLLLYTANPYILQIKEQVVRVPKQFARKSQSLEGYQVQEKSTILLAFFCIIKESTPID